MDKDKGNTSDQSARQVAGLILTTVMVEKRSLDSQFSNHPAFKNLSPQDRAFCQRLVKSTLRHWGEVDAAMADYFKKQPEKKNFIAKAHIYLAVTEIIYESIPSYAAISSAVDAVKAANSGLSKMVNAILRGWLRDTDGKLDAAPKANIPSWLYERWEGFYSQDMSAIAEVITQEAPLDIHFADPGNIKEFKAAAELAHMQFGNVLRIYDQHMVSALPGFDQGHWWVQDLAASLPVKLLGDVAGRTALDMCAAPGGKTMQLASLGAKVTALDGSEKRLEIVAENLARTQLEAKLICMDALEFEPPQLYDNVLLDAPCSATGTLRRNPDVKFIRSTKNLLQNVKIQQKLLKKGWEMLKSGGNLVYCVCSMEPEEGEEVIQRFLKTEKNATIAVQNATLPVDGLTADALGFRTHPGILADKGGMDGFFMTCLRKD